ncbi:hypothetical protein BKA67DRAFT_659904 [Truncatella angustata]|uniref:Uncharacterized protein n=1 Tax=Truncatella angustata TaxID=152316 RepID=A0A9P8ZXS5_9PEZI|nr:uncharacterized protein BKA67DRAFT_659904 [Truncatella angustata]KAH6653269.1 hypothetical protein BKA67DRAFT_659904 [Truncatella angustata]KAH8197781.1 hypothetical protein TruAng_008070 [Truncatella angustata]
MVSSSQATTASADASDDDASLGVEHKAHPDNESVSAKKLVQHEKHTKIEALVTWLDDGQSRRQPGLTFDLQFHASYNTAFFKLRSSVLAKTGSAPEKIPIFLFLAPEIIQTLSLCDDHVRELGPDTVCIRFGLRSAPCLVVPGAMQTSEMVWKNKESSDTWDSFCSLARATNLEVFCRLSRRVMSEARLQSLCATLSKNQVVSTPGYADLLGLYGGKGGKVVCFAADAKSNKVQFDESPPAYQDLGPGPPMPPVLEEKTSKRRRGNSGSEAQRPIHKPRDDLEATVAWLVTELRGSKDREALLASELKELHAKVAMLISQQEDHKAKCKILEHDLHERIGEVEAGQSELDEELEMRVDSRIDEILDQKSDSIKEELLDFIDEIVPNKIQGVLEEATFSARF